MCGAWISRMGCIASSGMFAEPEQAGIGQFQQEQLTGVTLGMDPQLQFDLEMLVVATAGLNVDAEFDLRPLGQAGGGAGIFERQVLDVLAHHLKIGELGRTIAVGPAFRRCSLKAFPWIAARALPWVAAPDKEKGTKSAPAALSRGQLLDPAVPLALGSPAMFGPLEMPDTQLIEILVAAMVAGIVLFQLYTILGRRTGHEPQPQDRIAPPQASSALRSAGRPAGRAPGAQPVRHPAGRSQLRNRPFPERGAHGL